MGLAVFGAAAVCTVVWLMILGRGLTFFYDEWDFINAAATTGYWHNVLQPHNGHPSMVPFSVYEVLLNTVGLRHYWPYQLILVLLDVVCGWLVFVLLRRKILPVIAGAAAAALMLFGPAWQDLLWPFQIGFLGSVAGGLGALVLLDRGTRRADLGACGCLVASVACSAVGLPFLAGVAVELAWRRQSWRRLWIPALPFALFIAWYEAIGKSSSTTVSPIKLVHSMASYTSTAVGALVGSGTTAGAVLSSVLTVLVVIAVVRSTGQAARLAMAVTGLLTFWVLILVARGPSPTSPSRYLYPAAAFVLVAAGELPALIMWNARGRHRGAAPAWGRIVTAVVAVGVVAYAGVAIWWNANQLTDSRDYLARVSSQVRADLGAVAIAGPALPGSFRPDPDLMPQVSVGPYLAAARQFGSSGDGRQQILTSGESIRGRVDAMLLLGRPMEVSVRRGPSLIAAHSCERHPLSAGTPLDINLPPGGIWIMAPPGVGLSLRVRSWSDAFPGPPLANLTQGSVTKVAWSAPSTAIRWEGELTPETGLVPAGSVATLCPVGPS